MLSVCLGSGSMRVVQVLYSGLGGHANVALSLAQGDHARKHQHALVFYGIEPLEPSYADACDRLGVRRAFVHKRRGLDVASWIEIAKTLEHLAPDVVILHSVNLVAPVTLWSRLRGVPIVAVDHTPNEVKRPKDWAFSVGVLLASDEVVYLTQTYRDEVVARYPRLTRRRGVRVIGNGIDLGPFAGSGSRRAVDGVFRVGMHSRFAPTKDHATLIEAFCLLRRMQPELACELVLAGSGETLAAVRDCARRGGLADRDCSFPGALPEKDLPAFFATLDVWCLSTRGETMSTALMQAMAAQLPVIVSDVPGVREMIDPGVNGLLVTAGRPADWAGALLGLANDSGTRQLLASRAAERATRWSNVEMFRRYDAVIAEVAATP